MDIKNYQALPEKPVSFEDWKANLAPPYSEMMVTSMQRLHKVDMKKEFEDMLKREYQEYVDNMNGNWLLK